MIVKVSAPGKLLLLGDHAVVYGYPCLVTAVDKRLYVEVQKINANQDDIDTPQVKESRFVLETLAFFRERFHIRSHVQIKTKGDFSHQVGLGSSSAVTVATFYGLNLLFQKKLTLKEIFEMSYHITLSIQGVGSGFDVAAATFGNTIHYVKGGTSLEDLHLSSLPLVVGYSGIKADTPLYIRKVAEAFRTRKKEMEIIFNAMTEQVYLAKEALQKDNFKEAGDAMNKNHQLLQKLGVSTQQLDTMVQAANQAGAWGAKLSGAGGGDCMIALVSEDKRKQVEEAIQKVGGEIITINVNTEGVRSENMI